MSQQQQQGKDHKTKIQQLKLSQGSKDPLDTINQHDKKNESTLSLPALIHKPRPIKLSFPWVLLYILRGLLCVVTMFVSSLIFFSGSSIVWLLNKVKLIGDDKAALYMARIAAVTMAVVFSVVLEKICGLELEFSGDKAPIGEDAIVFANHVTNLDVVCIVAYQSRKGMGGHGKFLSKDIIKHVPLFGWAMNMMGQVFLKRNWELDKSKVESAFDFLLKSKIPAQISLLPEGTRISEKKRLECLEFSKERGISPAFKQVLIPRAKGFAAIVDHMEGSHFKYVYDITLGYVDGPVRLRDIFLSSLTGKKILFNVKRIALVDIPSKQEEVQQWLYDRFYRKDKLISSMKLNRRFDGEPIIEEPFAIRVR